MILVPVKNMFSIALKTSLDSLVIDSPCVIGYLLIYESVKIPIQNYQGHHLMSKKVNS